MKTISKFFFLISIGTFAQKPIPIDTSYTVNQVHQKIKKDFPYAVPVKEEFSQNLLEFRDITYLGWQQPDSIDRILKLDIFRPNDLKKLPVVILVHGGGWRSGDKSMQIPLAKKLAEKGYVTVTVEYQMSMEAKYPAAVHNIKAAIRWVRANAKSYNADTSKIAISGCSAGGQLATLIAQTNGVKEFDGSDLNLSGRVHAAINIDGVVSFLAPLNLNLNRKPNAADVAWLGGTFTEKPEVWKQASGGYWVNENSVPMLFINSGFPRFHAGQDELLGQYQEFGIYYQVHKIDVKVHPFWLFHPWFDTTVNYMHRFLKKVF